MKKRIIHIIYNLARGGAETMLVQDIIEMKEYDHLIVTLQKDHHFKDELTNAEVVCLDCPSIFTLPRAVLLFKEIIRKTQPALVHSHLIFPNFVARCSVPKRIPLLTTIHNSLSHDFDYKKWRIRFLDRLTFSFRRSVIIGVSKIALSEYVSFLKKEPYQKYVLYTFVNEEKIKPLIGKRDESQPIKAVAVGALRLQKNYEYLLNKIALLKEHDVELDIYGDGPLKMELQKLIEKEKLQVKLKGQVSNINSVLPLYDLCISSSYFEGFSLAVLEAMAAKVPLLLSDIGSFEEQCGDTALYFDLNKGGDFEEKFNLLKNDKKLRDHLAESAYKRVIENYTFSIHLKKLRQIYIEALSQ